MIASPSFVRRHSSSAALACTTIQCKPHKCIHRLQSRQYGHQDQYGQARYQEPQARQKAMPALPRPTQAAQMGARQLPQASQQMAPPQWPAQPSRALAPAPAAWAQPAQNQVQPGSYMDMLNGTAPATSQAPPWQMQSMPHMVTPSPFLRPGQF